MSGMQEFVVALRVVLLVPEGLRRLDTALRAGLIVRAEARTYPDGGWGVKARPTRVVAGGEGRTRPTGGWGRRRE